jgi:hypothetical protein
MFAGEIPNDRITVMYQAAVSTRQFEIQMFWQRSNYFLALNTALGAGLIASHPPNFISFILSILGIAAGVLWYRVNLGSKYWQIRWEVAAAQMEQTYCQGNYLFATSWEEIKKLVSENLDGSGHTGIRKCVNEQIKTKPSVSYAMTLLSLLFIGFWIVALIYILARSFA